MLFFVEVEMLVGAKWLHTRSLNLGNANIERIRRQRRAHTLSRTHTHTHTRKVMTELINFSTPVDNFHI